MYYDQYLEPFLFEPYGIDMAKRVPTKGVESVLEIATGTGRVTRHLRQHLPGNIRLIASDLSPDMLNVAKEKLADLNNIQYEIADAQNLPFKSNSFDVVVCQFGLMFLPDKQKGFDEIYRVLKPGGQFLFYTWERVDRYEIFKTIYEPIIEFFYPEDTSRLQTPYSLHDVDQLKEYLTKGGFDSISVDRVELKGRAENAADLVNGFFTFHAMGKEIEERDPQAFKDIAKRMEEGIIKRFSEKPVVCALAAFLGSGRKTG